MDGLAVNLWGFWYFFRFFGIAFSNITLGRFLASSTFQVIFRLIRAASWVMAEDIN